MLSPQTLPILVLMRLRRRVRRLWNPQKGRTIAAVVAVALFIFVLYQDHHRSHSTSAGVDLFPALVAKEPIPKGTTGAAIGERRLYKRGEVSRSQLRNGAIFSPTAFAGRFELVAKKVTLRNIRPGSVLSPGDFGRATR